MRATAQDPDTAGLMGVDVNRTIALTFLIGGALAGAAGVAQILYNNATVYTLGFRFGLNSFTAAVLGGIGNLQGAVLGALVLGQINAFSDRYLSAELDERHRVRRPDRDPRLQADRPPRPAAGGPGMSAATGRRTRPGTASAAGSSTSAPSVCGVAGHVPAGARDAAPADDRPDGPHASLVLTTRCHHSWPTSAGTSSRCRCPDDTVVTFMMIFAIMAIGLNIVAGFAGLLDLGYVAFYAIGAYTAAFLASPHFGRSGST